MPIDPGLVAAVRAARTQLVAIIRRGRLPRTWNPSWARRLLDRVADRLATCDGKDPTGRLAACESRIDRAFRAADGCEFRSALTAYIHTARGRGPL